MAPKWTPLCQAMQLHCEPFYAAVYHWMKYSDRLVLKNRIQMLLCAFNLFQSYGCNTIDDTYSYDIVPENLNIELLPEVIPAAGKTYVSGGDMLSFDKVKGASTDKIQFIKIGVYFQDYILKPLAGWSPEILIASNRETRDSIEKCLSVLYRIPENAGKLKFTARKVRSFTGFLDNVQYELDLAEVAGDHLMFYEFMVGWASAATIPASKPAKPLPSARTSAAQQAPKMVAVKFHKDGRAWIHEAVASVIIGEQAARYFPDEKGESHLLTGAVTKYLPESAPGAGNQLYYVEFAQGCGYELNEEEFREGQRLLENANVWLVDDESVGMKVAARFPDRVYTGEVVKYSPPTAVGLKDQLYGILFEDEDREDWDQAQLIEGRRLYLALCSKKRRGPRAGNKRKAKEVTDSEEDSELRQMIASSKKVGKHRRPILVSSATVSAAKSTTEAPVSTTVQADPDEGRGRADSTDAFVFVSSKGRSDKDLVDEETVARIASSVALNALAVNEVLAVDTLARMTTLAAVGFRTASEPSVLSEEEEEEVEVSVERGQSPVVSPEEQAVVWSTDHPCVGAKVAAFFLTADRRRQLFTGTVMKYSAATKEDCQLYRIEFEDQDAADWEQKQLDDGLELYSELCESKTTQVGVKPAKEASPLPAKKRPRGRPKKDTFSGSPEGKDSMEWTRDTPLVGTRVAAYFPCAPHEPHSTLTIFPDTGRERWCRLYAGRVTMYAPPSSTQAGDQLFKIEFEDGDLQDYDQAELEEGLALYAKHY